VPTTSITRIENLETLAQLEVLHLADNYISVVEGVSRLTRLRELNLARNDIAHVGDALAANTALQVLNLSDNRIGSFKEVRSLSVLPALVDLCFADPMWGDCPLAALCNYQTYVLFVLPKLSSLDTLLLADETKQLAGWWGRW
jgi:protein phosphatase 1 regulatory subunit 7